MRCALTSDDAAWTACSSSSEGSAPGWAAGGLRGVARGGGRRGGGRRRGRRAELDAELAEDALVEDVLALQVLLDDARGSARTPRPG